MRALDRKLLRDLRQLRGQVVTVALVVACGIASYVALGSTWTSLERSRDTYYERNRFADVFASLERAPITLLTRIEAVDGLARAHTRIVEAITLPLPDMSEPVRGQVVSLPRLGTPQLNQVHLRAGRMPELQRDDEVLLLASFADAQGIAPGQTLPVVMGGVLRHVRVAGLAMSPEYLFPVAPGAIMPDPARFAVIWMPEETLASAFDMQGAFNHVVARLEPEASLRGVLERVDGLLEPFGGIGAHGRDQQPSHNVLSGELAQLQGMATVTPLIFLGVAAFLVNVVLSRLVQLQRTEIATLKALGYPDRRIAGHYLVLMGLFVCLGALLGVGIGAWLGRGMAQLYADFFYFPVLHYRIDLRVTVIAVGVSVLTAGVGAVATLRGITRLAPAEAMRPPPPARYRRTWMERVGVAGLLGQSAKMVVREIERRPLRTLLSSLGIAMAVAILVAGRFSFDALDYLIDVQFGQAQREDLAVSFGRAVPARALNELRQMPGVRQVEAERAVPVRFRHGARARDSVLIGRAEDGLLRQVVDEGGRVVPLPTEGIVLTHKLAEILDVRVGEAIDVELREGAQRTVPVPVVALAEELFGLQGYMQLSTLHRLMREEPMLTTALLRVEPAAMDGVYRRLRNAPRVIGVTTRTRLLERFEMQSGQQMIVLTTILVAFASIIAIGVVYNNARVALSMRSRELASLRVMGFTRGEISAVLLGELGVQVALAIVPGLWIGVQLAAGIAASVDPEQYRFPVVISGRTYAFAVGVTLLSALFSGLLVRRELDRLDLIGVLKTRE